MPKRIINENLAALERKARVTYQDQLSTSIIIVAHTGAESSRRRFRNNPNCDTLIIIGDIHTISLNTISNWENSSKIKKIIFFGLDYKIARKAKGNVRNRAYIDKIKNLSESIKNFDPPVSVIFEECVNKETIEELWRTNFASLPSITAPVSTLSSLQEETQVARNQDEEMSLPPSTSSTSTGSDATHIDDLNGSTSSLQREFDQTTENYHKETVFSLTSSILSPSTAIVSANDILAASFQQPDRTAETQDEEAFPPLTFSATQGSAANEDIPTPSFIPSYFFNDIPIELSRELEAARKANAQQEQRVRELELQLSRATNTSENLRDRVAQEGQNNRCLQNDIDRLKQVNEELNRKHINLTEEVKRHEQASEVSRAEIQALKEQHLKDKEDISNKDREVLDLHALKLKLEEDIEQLTEEIKKLREANATLEDTAEGSATETLGHLRTIASQDEELTKISETLQRERDIFLVTASMQEKEHAEALQALRAQHQQQLSTLQQQLEEVNKQKELIGSENSSLKRKLTAQKDIADTVISLRYQDQKKLAVAEKKLEYLNTTHARLYSENGQRGFFPFAVAPKDQCINNKRKQPPSQSASSEKRMK